jgi:hypothetical protein
MQAGKPVFTNNTPTNAGICTLLIQQHPYQCRNQSVIGPTTPLPMQAVVAEDVLAPVADVPTTPLPMQALRQPDPTTPLPMQVRFPPVSNNTPTNAGTTSQRANNTPTNAGLTHAATNNTPTNAGYYHPTL